MCGKEHHGQNREEKRRRLPRKIPMTRRRSPPDTVQQFSLSLSPRVNPHRKTAHLPYPTTKSSQPTECASTPQTARSRLHGLHRKSLRQNPGRTQNPDPRHRNTQSNNSIRLDSASFWRLQCVQHRPTNGTASVKIQSPVSIYSTTIIRICQVYFGFFVIYFPSSPPIFPLPPPDKLSTPAGRNADHSATAARERRERSGSRRAGQVHI